MATPDTLIRNIRCPECDSILRGDWTGVACDSCDATYGTFALLAFVPLARDEVARFTTTGALVAMTTAHHTTSSRKEES